MTRPDPKLIAYNLLNSYCHAHGCQNCPKLRAHCPACLQDAFVSLAQELTHPDCAIPAVELALTKGLVNPENMRGLARIFKTVQAMAALEVFSAIRKLIR
jgi:hypothetical protein